MDMLENILLRARELLDRLDAVLPPARPVIDWEHTLACRWQQRNGRSALFPITKIHAIRLHDLQDIETQKQPVNQNTQQFVRGFPANNVLLTGARGTGKSSLVKALLNEYSAQGLRVIEVDKAGLIDLPEIISAISARPEKFILYCDDLSFNAAEPGYQALKATLDGSVVTLPENLLIYATSNRRHLMPEQMSENLATEYVGDEIHPAEGVEEKISLSERFGLWVSFYPFTQEEYLNIVAHWLQHFNAPQLNEESRRAALQWALTRGSRSGRVAWQFARSWVGAQQMNQPTSRQPAA